MTVELSEIADWLRWPLLVAGLLWVGYWWRRPSTASGYEYRRALLGLLALAVLDYILHAAANWGEQPNAPIPGDLPLYSLVLLLAACVGLGLTLWFAHLRRIPLSQMVDAALVVVLAGALGARLYHVAMQWDYYSQNSDDVTNLAQGGMGLRGALLMGLLALWLFTRLTRSSFWSLADAGALGLSAASAIGWYGMHLTGANYGMVSDSSWAQELPDLYGLVAPRIPVQLLAVAFFTALFLVLLYSGLRRGALPGDVLVSYLIIASLGGWLLGSWRADETLHWNGWRVDQWVDLGLAALGLALLVRRAAQRRATPAQTMDEPRLAEERA